MTEDFDTLKPAGWDAFTATHPSRLADVFDSLARELVSGGAVDAYLSVLELLRETDMTEFERELTTRGLGQLMRPIIEGVDALKVLAEKIPEKAGLFARMSPPPVRAVYGDLLEKSFHVSRLVRLASKTSRRPGPKGQQASLDSRAMAVLTDNPHMCTLAEVARALGVSHQALHANKCPNLHRFLAMLRQAPPPTGFRSSDGIIDASDDDSPRSSRRPRR
jgi:hypothetical protein